MRKPKQNSPRPPRNPLVAPSRQRKAGSHRKTETHERQSCKRALRRELSSMH
ncbi:hypothetical protein [Eleftheria terrae]|uniref:hypothetical protein n=1 Tax=Eleftheria terrae TaxID=1597781 RepID=UPI00263AAD0B|nr:hypothetical protein [Eleftheria terrae]WKB54983.1 hypothetical protein N7L95_11645 [Eleftheria terrae]